MKTLFSIEGIYLQLFGFLIVIAILVGYNSFNLKVKRKKQVNYISLGVNLCKTKN